MPQPFFGVSINESLLRAPRNDLGHAIQGWAYYYILGKDFSIELPDLIRPFLSEVL